MNSHETAILQLLLTRGIGQRTLDRVLQSAAARGEEVGGAGVARPEWWQQFGLKPALAQAVAATREQGPRRSSSGAASGACSTGRRWRSAVRGRLRRRV